jgi:hypothetical protein
MYKRCEMTFCFGSCTSPAKYTIISPMMNKRTDVCKEHVGDVLLFYSDLSYMRPPTVITIKDREEDD